MEDYINVIDNNGMTHVVEVLDIFNVEGYNNDYIIYTKNKAVDEDNIEVFVSIIQNDNDSYRLLNITDDKEWDTVQRAILEIGEYDG